MADMDSELAAAPAGEQETPLCLRCMTPYVVGADLCSACSHPLSVLPQIGPVRGVVADMWLLGDLAHRQGPNLGLVVGAWIVLLPSIVGGGYAALLSSTGGPAWVGGLLGVLALAWCGVLAWTLYVITRNYRRGRAALGRTA
jgi:hypothetical protein